MYIAAGPHTAVAVGAVYGMPEQLFCRKERGTVAFFKMGGGFFVDIHFASGLLASFTYVFERGFGRET